MANDSTEDDMPVEAWVILALFAVIAILFTSLWDAIVFMPLRRKQLDEYADFAVETPALNVDQIDRRTMRGRTIVDRLDYCYEVPTDRQLLVRKSLDCAVLGLSIPYDRELTEFPIMVLADRPGSGIPKVIVDRRDVMFGTKACRDKAEWSSKGILVSLLLLRLVWSDVLFDISPALASSFLGYFLVFGFVAACFSRGTFLKAIRYGGESLRLQDDPTTHVIVAQDDAEIVLCQAVPVQQDEDYGGEIVQDAIAEIVPLCDNIAGDCIPPTYYTFNP